MKIVSWLRAMGMVALATVLASCGGGGGEGGGSSFSVGLSRNSVSWSYLEGVESRSPTVGVSWQGSPSSDVFVGLITANGRPDANIEQIATSYSASGAPSGFSLIPATGLRAGTYTNTLQFVACRDDMCRSHYPGSPANVSYSFTVTPNVRVTPQSLRLTGTAGSPLFADIGVELPASVTSYTAVADDPSVTISNLTNNGFRVNAPSRDAGTYNTIIRVRSGAMGIDVPLEQVASPRVLTLDRYEVNMTAPSASSATARVAVLQVGEGPGPVIVDSYVPQWLTVSDVSSTGFTLTARPLPAGSYVGQVHVRSGSYGSETLVVRHTVTSTGASESVTLQPRQLTITAAEGGRSATHLLTLAVPAWDPEITLQINRSSGATDWLHATRRPDGMVEVWADATGLQRGTYNASVHAQVRFPSGGPFTSVTFTVGNGLATPAAQSVLIHGDTPNATPSGSVPVVSQGATALNWAASIPASTDWLRLTRASGVLGQNVEFEVDMQAALRYPAYTDIQVPVTLNATSGGGALTPVTGMVTLRREPAEVSFVGPFAVAADKATTVQVVGRGFDRLADPAAHLTFGSVTPVSVTRLSPTTLAVQLPAMSAGSHTVSMSNFLGGPTASATLTVLPATTRAAGSATTGGTSSYSSRPFYHLAGLVQHPVRGDIYLANRALGVVHRLREIAGQWQADTLALPMLADVGLSPDGTYLVVTDTLGTLLLVDTATFTETARYTLPAPQEEVPPTSSGLAITNDGKVWLPGYWRLSYFDLAMRRHAYGPTVNSLVYSRNFNFEASRDGSRVVITGHHNNSGLGHIHMDTADGQWRAVTGTEFWEPISFDDNGGRMIANNAVYNRDFQRLGALTIPDAQRRRAAIRLSPDGRRAYLLATSTASAPLLPRVYVFSTEVTVGSVTDLPLLGSFDLDENPICPTPVSGSGSTCTLTSMLVSADGRSLVIGGSLKLMVVPLSTSYSTQRARSPVLSIKRWQPVK